MRRRSSTAGRASCIARAPGAHGEAAVDVREALQQAAEALHKAAAQAGT